MNRKSRHPFFLILIAVATVNVVALTLFRFLAPRFQAWQQAEVAAFSGQISERRADPDLWTKSLDKMKEDRAASENVGIEIPPELRHYPDRHWFLATQVAEVKKFNLPRCADVVDLAGMFSRGEVIPVPAVTDTYILFGVGARADDGAFTRYVANQSIDLNDEAGLRDAVTRLESEHARLQKEISALQTQLGALKHSARVKPDDPQDQLTSLQQELRSNDADKARLDEYLGPSDGSQRLSRDYESLQTLARNVGGRTFNLDDASDRLAFKIYLLSSLRPPALKILEEIAKAYHDKFDRPLPVSSLTRPEQYQRALRRVNRYAAVIDTPPHSTGLAFDIDYRYMSGAEQNFLMNLLARMKDEGRIEVLRERGANYHVFAFIDGKRPADDLITASLEEAGGLEPEPNQAETPEGKPENRRTKK